MNERDPPLLTRTPKPGTHSAFGFFGSGMS